MKKFSDFIKDKNKKLKKNKLKNFSFSDFDDGICDPDAGNNGSDVISAMNRINN